MKNKKIMNRSFSFDMSYEELLNSYSLVDLKDIGNTWKMKGLNRLKKVDLINTITKYILENLDDRFKLFNLDHLSIIVEILNGKNICDTYPVAASELLDSGLMLEGNLSNEKKVIIPQIIFEKFKQFYDLDYGILAFNTMLKDYMDLSTSLYGVIKEEEFVESFYEFSEKSFEKNMIESCLTYTFERTNNSLIENGFIHYYRLNKFEIVYTDIQTRNDISYRKIDQEMLQEFIKNGHIIWTDAYGILQEELEKNHSGDRKMALDVVDELKVMLSYNHSVSDFIQLFSGKNDVKDMVKIKKFADIIISINSEIPHWELKGNSPLQLSSFKKQETIIKGDKINRNDPCPCGSGEKYKKCCINK